MSSKIEGIKIIIVFAIAGVLIAMAIVLAIKKCCTVSVKEGFNPSPAPTSCPAGSKSFYDINSNVLCCDGTVNGNICEGTIICSFSHSSDKYPSCNRVKRYKYNGPINPFVVELMSVNFVSNFGQGLAAAAEIVQKVKTLPTSQISAEDVIAVSKLLTEEEQWYNENKKSPSIDYQRETMYIIESLTDRFKNKPIVNNKEIINQHLKDKLCTPGDSAPAPVAQCPACPVPTKRTKTKNANNPTGYVISGTDIEGEIPVQGIMLSAGKEYYIAQNNDRLILQNRKDPAINYSFEGKISDDDIIGSETFGKKYNAFANESIKNGTYRETHNTDNPNRDKYTVRKL